MGVHRAATLTVLVWLGILFTTQTASAQYVSYFAHGGQPNSGYGDWSSRPVPAAYLQAPMAGHGYGGASGQSVPRTISQAAFHENVQSPAVQGYADQGYADQGCDARGYPEESEYCDECLACGRGGCGTGNCRTGGGGGAFGPYEDNTCGPRWFNVSADFVFLNRETVTRSQRFTRDGLAGATVLDSDDLGFHEESGFRVTGRFDVGAASNIEATYLGGFTWSSSAEAISGTDNLYSVMSNFGGLPVGGYVETDQASRHAISYDSQLDGVELSYRRHWVSPSLRLHGSWLMGVRYTLLDERFIFSTHADLHNDPLNGNAPRGPGDFENLTKTSNNLLGFQLGGDAYVCLLPGLTVGGEIKAGVYGNHARQRTTVTATSISQLDETANSNHVAMIAEANLMAVYQLTPGWSFRGGYMVMFIDGVALAPENFNPNTPFLGAAPPRIVGINDNGNVLYHGLTAGFEWLW